MNWAHWAGLAAGGALAYGLGRKLLGARPPALEQADDAAPRVPPEVETDTLNYRICPACTNRVYEHEYFCIYCAHGAAGEPGLVVLTPTAARAAQSPTGA